MSTFSGWACTKICHLQSHAGKFQNCFTFQQIGRNMSRFNRLVPRLVVFALTLGLVLFPALSKAQSYPPSWSNSAIYAVGDLVQLGGNWYRALKSGSGSNPATTYANWELNYVRSNTTLMIGTGQTFPTLAAAWTYAGYSRVADGAYLHFYISSAHGSYSESFAAPFLLDHGSGARIAILGDLPAEVVLNFNNTNGLIVDTGHSINTISGLTIQNLSGMPTGDGLKVDLDATVSSVQNTNILGFQHGVHVTQNATATLTSTVSILDYGYDACLVETAGSIVISGMSIPASIPGSWGLGAQTGGVISASNVSIEGAEVGVGSESDGVVYLLNCNIQSCGYGIFASSRGFVEADITTINGSSEYDLGAQLGGYIYPFECTYSSYSSDGVYGSAVVGH